MKLKTAHFAGTVLLASAWMLSFPAQAFDIKSPLVSRGEAEFETRFRTTDDHRADEDGAVTLITGIGYGVTERWFLEIESEWEREAGERLRHEAVEIENIVQILPQGEYRVDWGMYAAYEQKTREGSANEITLGPILATDLGPVRLTANPFLSAEVGPNSHEGPSFSYGAQGIYAWHKAFAPGFEAFGSTGELGFSPTLSNQNHRIGPVLTGAVSLASVGLPGKIGYDTGVLFGLTRAAPDRTIKLELEYELVF